MRNLLIALFIFLGTSPAFASYQTVIEGDTPIVYYQMAESSGTTAIDSSGNSHTGTYSSSGLTYGVTGPVTATTAITYASGYLNTNQQSNVNPGAGNFSIEIWIKTTNTGLEVAAGALNSLGTGDNYWIGANSTTGKATFSQTNTINSGGVSATSTATVNDGAWHLLDGVLNGSTMTIYVDGNSSGTASWGGGTTSISGNLVAGQFGLYNGSVTWVGSLGHMAYYSYALTGTQVAAHYSAATGSPTMNISPATVNPHTNNITLTLTGSGGTTWTNGSTIFTVSGAGATKVSQSVSSNTAATVVINTASQSGTVTVQETVTGSSSNTVTVNTYIQYFYSPSGVPLMILEPASYVPGKGIRFIYYHMGHGEDDTALLSDPLKAGIVASALSDGYLMAGISVGNTWGNQASLTDYIEAYQFIATQYRLLGTLIWGQSMGGLAAQSNLAAHAYGPDVRGFIGIYPACSLLDMYSDDGGAFTAEINTAYNIPGGGTYDQQTAGYDPLLLSASQYQGNAEHFYSSYGDTVVMRANNTDPMSALVAPVTWLDTVVTTTGNHGDPSNFQPTDFMAFTVSAFRQTMGNALTF